MNETENKQNSRNINTSTTKKVSISAKPRIEVYTQSNSNTSSSSNEVTKFESVQQTRDSELKQLEILFKPYPEHFQVLSKEETIKMHIAVKPSDPDFPYELHALHLHVSLALNYPKESPRVVVVNADLKPELKLYIESEIRKKLVTLVGQFCLRSLIRWIDRNMEMLLAGKPLRSITLVSFAKPSSTLQNGKEIIEHREIQSQTKKQVDHVNLDEFEVLIRKKDGDIEELRNELLKKPVSKQLKETILKNDQMNSASHSTSSFKQLISKQETTEGSSSISDLGSNLLKLKLDRDVKLPTQVDHKGIQIKLSSLLLDEISLVECILLRLMLRCDKCHEFKEVNLSPLVSISTTCDRCRNILAIRLRVTLMHKNSSAMGYLDMNASVPFDILPSAYKITCASCDKESILHDVTLGQQYEKPCFSCHTKQRILAEGLRFEKLLPSILTTPVPAKSSTPKKKEKRQELGLKLGEPLENFGTCEHYGKSYRWLRFPCCGKAYPCDVCHEKKKTDQHEMVLANRMICGFCSKEQAYSQKPCSCGKSLVGSSTSRFWEGGKGCRDTSRLSRNDSRKHKSSILKTISRKASSKTNKSA